MNECWHCIVDLNRKTETYEHLELHAVDTITRLEDAGFCHSALRRWSEYCSGGGPHLRKTREDLDIEIYCLGATLM